MPDLLNFIQNLFLCPHSSFLIAHQARTFLRVCATRRKSLTDASICQTYTRATAATSNTTARHRQTSSARMLGAAAQAASLETGERAGLNRRTCTSHSPRAPSMPRACGRPQTWAWDAMGPAHFRSAAPTQKRLPPCPLSLSAPQIASRWRTPWKRSTAGAPGPR